MPFWESALHVTGRQLKLTLRDTAITRGRWVQVTVMVRNHCFAALPILFSLEKCDPSEVFCTRLFTRSLQSAFFPSAAVDQLIDCLGLRALTRFSELAARGSLE